MKKILTAVLLLIATFSAKAQFEQGTKYIGTYTSGLNLTYSSGERFRFNLGAEAGYFIADNFMAKANIGYQHVPHSDEFSIGLAGRYYIQKNGVFVGAGAEFVHHEPNLNDYMIPVEVGYCFFLNRHVTLQPSLYYKMSVNDFSDGSTFGLQLALGFYFK